MDLYIPPPPSKRYTSFINVSCSRIWKLYTHSLYVELIFIRQDGKNASESNWILLYLYSIWDYNEMVNTEIQDSNKPLTFTDLYESELLFGDQEISDIQ